MKLSFKQKQIHERALSVAIKYQRVEAEIIQVLREADQVRLHKSFGLPSLLKYAMLHLKLSEPMALSFIAVARKSALVPALMLAIDEGKISVSAANRLVSSMTAENSSELIDFATTHSWRETERELANRNPRAAIPDKVKMLGNGLVQITITVTEEEHKEFERACSVEAQRRKSAPKRSEVFVTSIKTHLDKYDPVRRADRMKQNPAPKNSERADQNLKNFKTRMPLTAAEIHAVHRRDRGRCTHVDQMGNRCDSDRWLQIHHLKPVSMGGSNDPANLTTLCSTHHDLAHQLTFPIEGQITWLRDKTEPYHA